MLEHSKLMKPFIIVVVVVLISAVIVAVWKRRRHHSASSNSGVGGGEPWWTLFDNSGSHSHNHGHESGGHHGGGHDGGSDAGGGDGGGGDGACDRTDLRPSDAELRQRLTGTWNIELRGPDGSSDSNFQGTFIFAADGSYRSEIVTTVSNEMRSVTLRGFARVQDGFLVGTLTNALPQWLPEGKRGRLPPGGVTSRTKIVRLDEQWLVFETNQFGSVVYTRVR